MRHLIGQVITGIEGVSGMAEDLLEIKDMLRALLHSSEVHAARLNGVEMRLESHTGQLKSISAVLTVHTEQLEAQSAVLKVHTEQLEAQSVTMIKQGVSLSEVCSRLSNIETRLEAFADMYGRHEVELRVLKRSH